MLKAMIYVLIRCWDMGIEWRRPLTGRAFLIADK